MGWDRVSYPLCPSLSCWNKASFHFLGKAQSDQASLRRSWNLTGFLRLALRMPTHFDSREKPSLWTRVSDALSDNGLAMSCSLEASVITSLLPLLDGIR